MKRSTRYRLRNQMVVNIENDSNIQTNKTSHTIVIRKYQTSFKKILIIE